MPLKTLSGEQVHQFPHLKAQVEQETRKGSTTPGKAQVLPLSERHRGLQALAQKAQRSDRDASLPGDEWRSRAGIAEKVREKRVENPDTSSASLSTVTRHKSLQK